MGMSNALTCSVNDVTSGYWNPAGLTGISSNLQLAAMHSEYFAGIAKYDYAAIATHIDSSSALSLSYIRFGIDDIPNTIDLIDPSGNINYDRIKKFSASDNAFLVSYARHLKIPGLRAGASAKVIYRKAGDFARAWGFGLDAGIQYDRNNWRYALMARDVTTTFNAWRFDISDRMKEVFATTGNDIPENSTEITLPKFILGVAHLFKIKEIITILPELDADLTTDGKRNVLLRGKPLSLDPHAGIEFGYKNIVFLRGGTGNYQYITSELGNRKILTFQPNMGVGLKIRNLTIDYALTDIGDQSVALYSHIISLKLDINKKTKPSGSS